MALQHLRSGTAHKRPIPTAMSAGQIAVNTNEASPGLFFKDSNGDLVKVGPVHIGTTAPNASPASTAATALVSGTIYQILTVGTTDFTTVGASTNTVGTVFTATGAGTGDGTVSGQQGVEKGEQWLDTTGGNYVLKIYDGSAWRSESGTFVDSSGDTMTGALLLDNAASASAPDLSFDGDSNTGIYSPGANKLAISTGGAQRLFVDADGDVGIGTNSPGSRLEIVDGGGSGSAEVLRVKRSNGADACVFRIDLDPDLNIVKYQATGSQGGTHAFGQGGGSESMRIGSNGRVGIGTTSPTQLIDLEASDGGRIAFTDTGTRRYSIGNAGTGSSSLTIRDDSGAADRIVINSAGQVGIGTSTPGANLHIQGASFTNLEIDALTNDPTLTLKTSVGEWTLRNDASVSDQFAIRYDNASRFNIDATGDVGIGYTTPSQKLDVNGNIRANSIFYGSTYAGRDDTNTYVRMAGSDLMEFYTGNSERMRITSLGSVGIGTSNPTSKLQVEGTIRNNRVVSSATGDYTRINAGAIFRGKGGRALLLGVNYTDDVPYIQGGTADADTGTRNIVLQPNGANVGIGTTSPSAKLHVQGASLLKGELLVAATGTNGEGGQITLRNPNGTDTGGIMDISSANQHRIFGTANNYTLQLGQFGGTGGKVQLYTQNIERMRIEADGKVGIGTSSPSTPFVVSNSGAHGFEVLPQLSGDTVVTTYNRSTSAYNPLRVRASVFKISPDGNEKIRITSDGKVGIGITAPTELLEIQDPTAARAAFTHTNIRRYSIGTKDNSSTFTIRDETGSADRLTIRSTGNIGIGTGDPAGLLHIQRSDDNFIRLSTGTTAANTEQGLLHYGRYIFGTTPAHPGQLTSFIKEVRNGSSTEFALLFGTTNSSSADATERMRITASGNVGIGTTAPSQELVVAGGSVPTLRLSDTDTQLSDDEDSSAIEFYQSDASGPGVNASIHARGRGSTGNLDLQFNAGNNTEKMRITNSGYVGIGTPDPDSPLEIKTTSATDRPLIRLNTYRPGIRFVDVSNNASDGEIVHDGDMRFRISQETGVATALTERMRLTATGRLGIGSTNPGRTIAIYNNDPGIRITDSDSASNHFDVRNVTGEGLLQVTGNKNLKVYTNGNEHVRINGSGQIMLGMTTQLAEGSGTLNGATYYRSGVLGISANGDRPLFLKRLNSNGTIVSFRRDNTLVGTIGVTTTSTTYNTSSDYRLKENVVELGGAIDRINQLQPKRFNFIAEPGTTVDGFLAHEAQAVVPEAVTGTHNEVDDEGNPVMQGIDQSKLVPLLTAALQEALAKIATLETKVAALEAGS